MPENMPDTVIDVNEFDLTSIEKLNEKSKKSEKSKWVSKKCPLLFCNSVMAIVKFDDKHNLQFNNKDVDTLVDGIIVEFQGEIGKKNFKYRVK